MVGWDLMVVSSRLPELLAQAIHLQLQAPHLGAEKLCLFGEVIALPVGIHASIVPDEQGRHCGRSTAMPFGVAQPWWSGLHRRNPPSCMPANTANTAPPTLRPALSSIAFPSKALSHV